MQKCFRDEHARSQRARTQHKDDAAHPFFDRVRDVTRSLTGSLLFIYLFVPAL
jgi:hypothetical protein